VKDVPGLNGWHLAAPRSQQPPSSRAPRWLVPQKDPLERVLGLGGDKALRVMVGALILTLAGHGLAAVRTAYIHAEMIAWTMRLDVVIDQKMTQEVDIDTMRPPPPPPAAKKDDPPPPPPPQEKAEPKQEPAAPAQAAQVLAQNPDNQVMDFGDNVFVVGKSERFAGGRTTSNGTSTKPPQAPHVADKGTGSGINPPAQVMEVDLSRTAELAGSGEWRCPFPPEADADQVDDAAAIIAVVVGASGRATSATILQDPGHGFGREARACALRESYVPALDRQGRAVASTKKFRVKFER
jgi:protein TonB